jgi:flagellin-like protein
MMKKNWKDRKGVSPVIATILMVAITVVLGCILNLFSLNSFHFPFFVYLHISCKTHR